MDFILDPQVFRREAEEVEMLTTGGPFSKDHVSTRKFPYEFVSFSSILNRAFFRSMKAFCRNVGDDVFLVLATEPDPYEYKRKFGRFNTVVFDLMDSEDDYLKALNDGPRGNTADSLMDGSERLLLYSRSRTWLLVADRSSNLTLCCFSTKAVRDLFEQCYESAFFDTQEEAAAFSCDTGGDGADLSSFLGRINVSE